MEQIHYRYMRAGEQKAVHDLVKRSFMEFVAPAYSQEGIQEFLNYIEPDAILERSKHNHCILVAEIPAGLAGVIEVRRDEHISMLFVEKEYQRQGIGRGLMREVLEVLRADHPELDRITVFSSPYAVPVYEKCGFRITGPEQTEKGMRFVPMTLNLSTYDETSCH